MNDKQVSPTEPERLQGVSSLLSIGEIECDKCGKKISHADRYCCNTHECPACEALFDTITEVHDHFSQKHPHEPSRGTRYCIDCSLKHGHLEMARNKKTGEIFLTIFTLRDEEAITENCKTPNQSK